MSNDQQPVYPPNDRPRKVIYVQIDEPGSESKSRSLTSEKNKWVYVQSPPRAQSQSRLTRSASTRHGKPFLSLAAVRSGLQGGGDWAPGSCWSRAAVVCHVCLDKMSCCKGAAEAELTCEYTGCDNPR